MVLTITHFIQGDTDSCSEITTVQAYKADWKPARTVTEEFCSENYCLVLEKGPDYWLFKEWNMFSLSLFVTDEISNLSWCETF